MADNDKTPPKMVTALRITSLREGFRRAGHAWSVSPTIVYPGGLSKDEIALLKKETMLLVEEVKVEALPDSGVA